ncbi:conserved exported hypothetical protein [Sphingorhabdus sp. 109]|jgi:hypothetical protein|nr:conserved exported hypothetical protein [Sphingorhabdus sp. 109]
MRIISSPLSFSIAVLTLAACSSAPPEPAPAPEPVKPVSNPAAPQPPAQPQGKWTDWPITTGDWVYRKDERGSLALFGATDEPATVMIRCDRPRGQIFLSRAGAVGNGAKMVLRASAGLQSYPAKSSGGTPPYAAISISPGDIMLDRIAYSRGRFAIETTGLKSIAVPAWPQFSRVVEDCRR